MLFKNIPPQVGHATTLSCAGVLKCSHNLRFLLSTPKQSKTNKQEKNLHMSTVVFLMQKQKRLLRTYVLLLYFKKHTKKAASREKKNQTGTITNVT